MLGFLIALGAGFLTPHIAENLSDPVIKLAAPHVVITQGEKLLLGFMMGLLAAGLIAALLHSGTPFWVILGAILGYFGTRLVALAQKLINRATSNS